MFAAEWHLHFRSSHEYLSSLLSWLLALGEQRLRSIRTIRAERLELRERIRLRDEIQNLTKWLAICIAIQAHYDHILVRLFHSLQDELLQIWKELGLLHDDQLGPLKFRRTLLTLKGRRLQTRNLAAIVIDNLVLLALAVVGAVAEHKNRRVDGSVTVDDAEDRTALARKHRTQNEFKAHRGSDTNSGGGRQPRQFYLTMSHLLQIFYLIGMPIKVAETCLKLWVQ